MTRRRGSERGTGLLEVMLAATLFLAVMAAILQVHTSFAFAAQHREQVVEARATSRMAAHELRGVVTSAAELLEPAGKAEASTELVVRRPATALLAPTLVQVRFDRDAGTIDETVIDEASGKLVSERRLLDHVVEPSTSFVRWFGPDGRELVPGEVDTATMAGCASRIEFALARTTSSRRAPLEMTASATPRSVRAEERSC